jgi:hypothetical protein
MLGRMGRAECLAATAMVVAARLEPVEALRRLASEDPGLRRLERVATRLAAGLALPEALAACRLLSAAEARRLAAAGPEALADRLTRLAQSHAEPVPGELLARWLPLWAVLVATLPSLIIGSAVALIAGSLYGGLWDILSLMPHHAAPAAWWFAQAGATLCAVAILAAAIWTLRRTPLWLATTVSLELERAILLDELVHAARAGADGTVLYRRWALLTGDGASVRHILERSGGDLATALVDLGVVPRDAARQPDWVAACAGTRLARRQAADAVTPWLTALLIVLGLAGFLTWGISPFVPMYQMIRQLS